MSDKNRVKLFDVLAKLNILSKTKFQYFYPSSENIKCTCSQPCKIYLGKKIVEVENEKAFNCKIKAGEVIKLIYQCKDDKNEKVGVTWKLSFIITNKSETVRETLDVSGFKDGVKSGDIVGKFTIPLISPWRYSNNIKEKYNIDTKNLFVNSYPEHCRN